VTKAGRAVRRSTGDGLSGVLTEATVSVTGGTSIGVGSFTASCTGASDKAGNPGAASASYTVVYAFAGFFSPVDNPPVLNIVKAGQRCRSSGGSPTPTGRR